MRLRKRLIWPILRRISWRMQSGFYRRHYQSRPYSLNPEDVDEIAWCMLRGLFEKPEPGRMK